MSEKVAMPGDADEPGNKVAEVLRKARGKAKSGEQQDEGQTSNQDAASTSDQLDEAQDVTKARASSQKGPLTPAQYEDDGWGDTPVQMREQ